MEKKRKARLPVRTKNFKISTRIVISSVLAIVIPIIILSIAAGIFLSTFSAKYYTSSSDTDSYSVLSQLQWSQVVSNMVFTLSGDESDDEKLALIEETLKELEDAGSVIYIEKDGAVYYSSADPDAVLAAVNTIADIDMDTDSYYYSDTGCIIVNSFESESGNFTVIAANNTYGSQDGKLSFAPQYILHGIANNAAVILGVCVTTFILAIIILSCLTSKTIIGPIEKITKGANEIAKGNLDYEIDYQSTNEIGQLAQSFNDMRLRVKESIESKNRADQQQKEIVAGIAHDLRTPLTSIKGYLEGIRDGVADTPEKRVKYLETIYDSAVSMEKMLNDLLIISKLELGNITLNCENVHISDFIPFAEEIGNELKKQDFDYKIINKTKSDPLLFIDTDRFSRVITNIISNSIKYRRSEVRGKIVMILSEYEQSVIFELADNGTGVDPKSLTRIFDTLYREDKARSNVSDGSGLGLAVCKQIVELHGGMIWARNNSENGLSIFISLPKAAETEENSHEKNTDH